MADTVISVIVPVYNVGKYLGQCLENLLHQTYRHLEILIVNDGSTDNSLTICEDYAKQDSRIKVITQENSGLSAARNAGLEQATGTYIHFMDSDDFINLDYYEKMIAAATGCNADMACSGFHNQRKPRETVTYTDSVILTAIEDKMLTTEVLRQAMVWRFLFKRSFLQKHNLGFEKGRLVEDIMFSIPAVYHADKIVIVPQVMYHYRHNLNSILTVVNPARQEKLRTDTLHVKTALNKFAHENGFTDLLKISRNKHSLVEYKLFTSMTVMEKRTYPNRVKYYLFGKIPVLTLK